MALSKAFRRLFISPNFRVLAFLFLLPGLGACIEGSTDSHITPIQRVSEVASDSDGVGKVLTVAGQVTLRTEGKKGQPDALHIQDETAAIDLLLPNPDTLLKVGDYVVAKGTVEQTEGELRLLVMSHQVRRDSGDTAEPVAIPEDQIDLAAHHGLLVSFTGRVVRMSEDAEGAHVVLSRSGGPIAVRSIDGLPALSDVTLGDRLQVRGVLFTKKDLDGDEIPYQVYLRSPEDLAPIQRIASVPVWWWAPALLVLLAACWIAFRRREASTKTIIRKSASSDAFFAGLAVPALLLDGDLRIRVINRAAATLFGTTQREIKKTSLFDHISSPETEDSKENILERLDEGGSVFLKGVVNRAGGGSLPLECHLNRIEESGRSCVAAILLDRSDEADETRLFEDFHRTVIEHVPVEVSVLTPRGEYVYVNPQVAKEKEVREWLVGKTDIEYCKYLNLHPEVALRRRNFRKKVITEGEPVEFEEVLAEDGGRSTRHFRRVFYPVANKNGEPYLIVSFGIDTTELRRVREEAREAISKAHEAKEQEVRYERLRTAVLDNLNHEFRTPLTGIIGASQIIRMEAPDALGEFVDIIERNGDRLIQTVNTLLDLACLESDNVNVTPRLFNVADEVAEVVKTLEPLAANKGLFLRMNVLRPEMVVFQDLDALRRAVHHLVDNAIKFTKTGGVVVELDGTDDAAVLRVIDTGVGIAKEHLPYLFDAFNQESIGRSRAFEGTGIGLAVCKRLLDLMDAHVSVDSERDSGTTFTVTIPLSVEGDSGKPRKRPRILVLDESIESHRIIEYMLGSFFHVRAVKTIGEAKKEIGVHCYDVLLADSHTTNRGEVESLLELVQGLPVVVMDAIQLPGAEAEYRAGGYAGYLTKPLDRRELLRTVGNAVAAQTTAKTQATGYAEITS